MFCKETDFQDSVIGKYPKDWDIVRIDDKFDTSSGGTPDRQKKEYYNGSIPWVKSGELRDKVIFNTEEKITEVGLKNSAAKTFPKGTVLVAMYGATVGKTGILGIDATTNQAVCALLPKEKNVDVNYLKHSLVSIRNRWIFQSAGGAQPNISQEIIRSSRIPFPPFKEQQQIADVLGVVDSAIELADKVIAKTERLKKGLMQQLLTHGIGHTEYKYSKELGSEVPKDWDVIKYEGANERIFVGIATSSTKHFASEGIPLIRNQNIKEKGIDLNNLTYITKNFAEANKSKMLKENDIITVRTGFPGLSGKVTKKMEGWQTFTTLISRPKLGEFDPDYLVYVLNSPVCKNQISRLKAGLAQQNLNVGAIVNLYVPKPSKNEQIQIAERIRILYEKQRIEEAYFEKLKLIKQGLMNELLTGKVRIKVD